MYKSRQKRRLKRGRLRGVAIAELAVCMPVLALIVLATIESCTIIFLQQSLSIAAYEGARVSIVPGAKSKNVVYQCELILQSREVKNSKTNVTPRDIPNAPAGTWIKVDISAPFADNSMLGGWLFNESVLSASVEMMKER